MRKYDRSLIEVWEWKEKVYHDVRDLSPEEYLVKIKNDADKILSESHIKWVGCRDTSHIFLIQPCSPQWQVIEAKTYV